MRGQYLPPDQRYKILTCGHGGLTGRRIAHGWTEIPDNRITPYLGDLAEGGVVLDLRTIPDKELVKLAIAGPMVNPELADDEVDRFVDKVTDENIATAKALSHADGGEGNPFYQYIVLAERIGKEKFTGFDYISIKKYTALYWAAGAKVGIRRGDYVFWRQGDKSLDPEKIPSPEARYHAKT